MLRRRDESKLDDGGHLRTPVGDEGRRPRGDPAILRNGGAKGEAVSLAEKFDGRKGNGYFGEQLAERDALLRWGLE